MADSDETTEDVANRPKPSPLFAGINKPVQGAKADSIGTGPIQGPMPVDTWEHGFPQDWVAPVPQGRPAPTSAMTSGYNLPDPVDDWGEWVEKQLKQLRIGVAASFGLAAVAIGMAGLLGKVVNDLMQGLNQLAENQKYITSQLQGPPPQPGEAIPMPPVPRREDPGANSHAAPVASNTAPKDRSIPDPTVDPNAQVAEPASGPGGEASQRVKDLLAADGVLSMKDTLPDALAVPEAAVNPEAKHSDVRHLPEQ